MKLLAIDTGGDCCALGLRIDGQLVATTIVPTERDQAKLLAPLTQELLKQHKLSAPDINRFAVATGPGSFTGLRVGLAFTRGLGLATQKPVVGIDYFTIYAYIINQRALKKPCLFVRESKRDELFCAWMNEKPFLATPAQLAEQITSRPDAILTGNGAAHILQLEKALASRHVPITDADIIDALGSLAGDMDAASITKPQPLYLRDADVSQPKPIIRRT